MSTASLPVIPNARHDNNTASIMSSTKSRMTIANVIKEALVPPSALSSVKMDSMFAMLMEILDHK